MRIDTIVREIGKSLAKVLEAFDHNITVRDNFGPEGALAGSVLTSNGPDKIPTWQGGGGGGGDDEPSIAAGVVADDVVEGILPEERLDGPYRGVTQIGQLIQLEVDGLIIHNRTLSRDAAVPTEWGAVVAGPYTIASGVTLNIAGEMRVI